VRFVNLQYGDCAADLATVRQRLGIEILHDDAIDPLSDMDGFAAQVAAMDLVVSIDNSTVHLAGALGKPTWVLLPYVPDWRWLLDRDDSPWYGSVKLYRQCEDRNWEPVLQRVAQDMVNLTQ
jgi:ADP-heptose:LPS heptosyltransferase